MTAGEAVVALLAADSAVVAIVGARMYPNVAPQGAAAPFLVYQVISDVPENSLADNSPRLSSIRLQVDCYSPRYLQAHALAEAVEAKLVAASTPDFSAWRDTTRDLFDAEAQMHRVSTDFAVWR